jgi:hypothetical protein
MKKIGGLRLMSVIILFLSCTEEDEIIRCDAQPAISESLFATTSTPVNISNASILTDCLEIRFSYTGCTELAIYDLAVSEVVSDTSPPSRSMRIVVAEEGNCNISQTQTYRIDLSLLQVENTNRLTLHLDGWPVPLVYGY